MQVGRTGQHTRRQSRCAFHTTTYSPGTVFSTGRKGPVFTGDELRRHPHGKGARASQAVLGTAAQREQDTCPPSQKQAVLRVCWTRPSPHRTDSPGLPAHRKASPWPAPGSRTLWLGEPQTTHVTHGAHAHGKPSPFADRATAGHCAARALPSCRAPLARSRPAEGSTRPSKASAATPQCLQHTCAAWLTITDLLGHFLSLSLNSGGWGGLCQVHRGRGLPPLSIILFQPSRFFSEDVIHTVSGSAVGLSPFIPDRTKASTLLGIAHQGPWQRARESCHSSRTVTTA